jgi:peptidoglycan/LPS O-acetylase OafA/YrhL
MYSLLGGAVFYKHKDKLLSWLSSKAAVLVLGLLFLGSQLYYNSIFQGNFLEKEPVLLIVGVISIFAVLSYCVCTGFQNYFVSKTLEVLGKYSMGIYVMHVIAGAAARVLLKKLGVEDFYTHLVLGTIVGVVGPLVACKVFEAVNFKYMFSAPITGYLGSILKRDRAVG